MSINQSGLKSKTLGGPITVSVSDNHPLIVLANSLPWQELFEIILPDLQKTTLGKWWCGRALKVRIHLGVYILQQLYNKKDRQIENEIKENAAYQVFCGKNIIDIKNWHCPDHTKIEEFRSRITPQAHQALANAITGHAVKLGFADAREMDVDSTIQEANITYPRDANLIVKLASIAHKVGHYFNETFIRDDFWHVDIKKIKSLARSCYYGADNALIDLWELAHAQVRRVRKVCDLMKKDLPDCPWNITRAMKQLKEYGYKYFMHSLSWIERKKVNRNKALSFHCKDVSCFSKKHKNRQFGRSHQLARIKGNFLFTAHSTKVRMEDKACLPDMITLHQELFGQGQLQSVVFDRGYSSQANYNFLESQNIAEIGLRLRGKKGIDPPQEEKELQQKLQNRRAGIEPLIGHLKQNWQMGRTRMKNDQSSLSSAYTSVLGFNVRQLMRHQMGKAA